MPTCFKTCQRVSKSFLIYLGNLSKFDKTLAKLLEGLYSRSLCFLPWESPSGTTPSRSLDQRVYQDSLNTLYILIANGIDDAYPKINALAELTRFADDAAPPPRPWHRVRQLHWAHHRQLTRLHTNLKRHLRPSSYSPPS